MKKTVLIAALALVGCQSSQKKEQPQPRMEEKPGKPAPAVAKGEDTAPQGSSEPVSITIKKGDKRVPEANYQGGQRKAGHVCFEFKDLDLEKAALPLFSDQAGVRVEYHGKPRKLTLSFNSPVPWQDALGLICQWTNTHVTRSPIVGRLELKEGYADPQPFLAKFDPNDKNATDAGAGVVTEGSQPARPQGGNQGSGGTQFDASDYQQPTQPGADTIENLRKNVTPTNSGVK